MEYSEACSDIWYLLENLEPSELAKIPKKLLETINILKIDGYTPKIDLNTPLEEQKISEATIGLISFIYNNYLGTKEEKEEYERRYKEYIKSSKEENYKIEFKNKNTKYEVKENKMIKYSDKSNIFLRLLQKVKSLFAKK